MSIDAWLSGEEGTRVVEAMCDQTDGHFYGSDIGRYGQRAIMVAALRAALSLTTTELCSACGGAGCAGSFAAPESTRQWMPNPDCKGGTVPGESVLVLRERLEQTEARVVVVNRHGIPVEQTELLYRLRPLEKEDET